MESQSSVTLTPSQPMVAHKVCQQAVIDALIEAIPKNLMPETLQVVPVFDRQSDRYQLLCQGWTAGEQQPSSSCNLDRSLTKMIFASQVEFGAKFAASCVDGNVFLDRLRWESFNQSGDLPTQVEQFKQRYGSYPESVHADPIYRNDVLAYGGR